MVQFRFGMVQLRLDGGQLFAACLGVFPGEAGDGFLVPRGLGVHPFQLRLGGRQGVLRLLGLELIGGKVLGKLRILAVQLGESGLAFLQLFLEFADLAGKVLHLSGGFGGGLLSGAQALQFHLLQGYLGRQLVDLAGQGGLPGGGFFQLLAQGRELGFRFLQVRHLGVQAVDGFVRLIELVLQRRVGVPGVFQLRLQLLRSGRVLIVQPGLQGAVGRAEGRDRLVVLVEPVQAQAQQDDGRHEHDADERVNPEATIEHRGVPPPFLMRIRCRTHRKTI